jgi:hypothetical protein
MREHRFLLALGALSTMTACSSVGPPASDRGNPGSGGSGGPGAGGAGASAGNAGSAGSGTGGASGAGAQGGSAGDAGTAGAAGSAGSGPSQGCELGYGEHPNGRGGVNVEAVCYSPEMGFDITTSLKAFTDTVYPLLSANCSRCHSTETKAQAPIHSDVDVEVAHRYALTRVNFRKPADSKLVVRMGIDRHNCFGTNCRDANTQMLAAVTAWANAVTPTLKPTPALTPTGTMVSEQQVTQWIQADQAKVADADKEFIKYTSLHELQNSGATPDDMNVVRVAISKVLNSDARWAPKIVNPIDVSNGQGIVYRFDTRDYWGHNKGVKKLLFGGSDDDIVFALEGKKDYLGNQIASNEQTRTLGFTKEITKDDSFAKLVWGRVIAGNVEGALGNATLDPNTKGFKTGYVEAAQLVYTLSRPDVYNSIMALPWFAAQLETELGVVKDPAKGAENYMWVLTKQAITVDSRTYFRAKLASGGYYWKTWDVFTGQLPTNLRTIEQAYDAGMIRFPFWANPIPKFINGTGGGTTANSLSFIATLAQPLNQEPPGCEGQPNFSGISGFLNCRYYTGTDGLQQSAEEIIFSLPNGLQAYYFAGGYNQRRVDAFTNIVRDPRLARNSTDTQVLSSIEFQGFGGVPDHRLNVGSSCFGCHTDGMNRGSNDLREWLDNAPELLPKGEHGVDKWINDQNVVAQVKKLYPTNAVVHDQMEADRRPFLAAMAQIKKEMVAGPDKNVYVEPIIWTIEWAQKHYSYPQERSN